MAAGISVASGEIGPFRSFLCEKLEEDVEAAQKDSGVKIDAALTARGATVDFFCTRLKKRVLLGQGTRARFLHFRPIASLSRILSVLAGT